MREMEDAADERRK